MKFRGLLFAMTAVFMLVLLSTTSVPPQGIVLAAAASGDDDDDGRGSPIEGRRIFVRENCYSCHGGFAGGAMCPSLREDPPDRSDVEEVVREGTESGMPPFPELTDRDIQNLAAYFQTLRTRREPTFLHWWEPVPTQ